MSRGTVPLLDALQRIVEAPPMTSRAFRIKVRGECKEFGGDLDDADLSSADSF